MAIFQSLPSLRRNFVIRYSPWMLIGVALILALVITILTVRNAQRERTYISQNLIDRADALIWAVEAGTRVSMGMRTGMQNVQAMVEETAKQTGVIYIVVTDASGNRITSSSEEESVDKNFYGLQELSTMAPSDKSQWRTTFLPDGGEVFEVYRTFKPLPGFQQHIHHNRPRWGNRRGESQFVATQENGNLLIFVGLDMEPFEEALVRDFRNTTITGIIVGLLALGGFISLFWAQHYRLSRRALQDTNAFASEVVTSIPNGLVATDKNNRITLVNSAASYLFCMSGEKLEGMSLHSLSGIPWGAITALVEKGLPVHEQECTFITPEGGSILVSVSASSIINDENVPLGYLYLVEDIRERKRVQEQLRRSERLSALGHMAARVAHEIRNPLSSIKGFARFFSEKVSTESGKEIAFTMMEEVDRLNRVVTELLDFARPSPLALKPGDIREVIDRAIRLTRDDAVKKSIETTFTVLSEIPAVSMDFEHLTQVFLNLFINAIQAMDQDGKLVVTASAQGSRVAVTVSDTGQGMSPEVRESIFIPYYTTKPAGTGLGLSIVLKILDEHDCEIKVDSVPGLGTTFVLLLPLATTKQG